MYVNLENELGSLSVVRCQLFEHRRHSLVGLVSLGTIVLEAEQQFRG